MLHLILYVVNLKIYTNKNFLRRVMVYILKLRLPTIIQDKLNNIRPSLKFLSLLFKFVCFFR